MSRETRQLSKVLHALVSGNDNFSKNDLDEYIYCSLTQPPLKVISKNNSDDEMDWSVECPHCHSVVNYGTQIFMVGGHIYCKCGNCREEVTKEYMESKKYV